MNSLTRRGGASRHPARPAVLGLLTLAMVAIGSGGIPAVAAGEKGTGAQARAGQWWLGTLGVTAAHGVTQGKGVKVCVIDVGIVPTHPDLVGVDFLPGADLSGTGRPDGLGTIDGPHGTQMAALLAGQGSGPGRGEGILGVAPQVSVISVSVPEDGDLGLSDAIKECADRGAAVISASVASDIGAQAVAYAQARDIVLVAPTGNESFRTGIARFAAQWGVVAVTGVDAELTLDPRANSSGAYVLLPEIEPTERDRGGTVLAAPFSRLANTDANCPGFLVPALPSGYVNTCGTSNGTAIVAGAAALVRAAYPDLNAANVINRLVRTAKAPKDGARVPSPLYGYGVVDVYAALTAQVAPVEHSPIGSCYTGSRGVWDARVAPTRPEPPVGSKPAPAPWRDPIPDVPAATTGTPTGGPRATASTPAAPATDRSVPGAAGSNPGMGNDGSFPGWVWGVLAGIVALGVVLGLVRRRGT